MKLFKGTNGRAVVSLCDYSGNWPKPYAEAGYTVIQFDLKHGDDVTDVNGTIMAILEALGGDTVAGILAAPPCTDFSVSGAQYWPRKDADGTTDKALAVLDACRLIVAKLRYWEDFKGAWWALENPVGRIPKLRPNTLGKPLFYFNPCDYAGYSPEPEADRYTKKTGIWGDCRQPETKPLEPIRVCPQGSWIQKLGGKSERTKELRSMTPRGFAKAFFLANP